MSFLLRMSGVIVGRSELETRDVERRVVSGVFRPGLGYDLVQPVFALYEDARDPDSLARYRKARDALRLQLTAASGTPVQVRDLHIRRAADSPATSSSLVLEIESDDPSFWGEAEV
jgi:hypothetical protein